MLEIRCPACAAVNRIPVQRAGTPARCGRCKSPMATAVAPVTVSDATLEAVVLKALTPVLLDCWADWCGPCHMLAPTLEALARDHAGRLLVGKLDVEANRASAARFDIRGLPTLLIFDRGQVVDHLVGVQPRPAIEARLAPWLAASR